MLLNDNEKIVFKEQSTKYKDHDGTLYLTNQRLIFRTVVTEKQMFGLKERKIERLIINSSLENISDVSIEKSFLGKPKTLDILFKDTTAKFSVDNAEVWKQKILSMKTKTSEKKDVAAQNVPNIVVNVVSPQNAQPQIVQKEVIEKQVVKIRCRYCGTLVDEGVSTCPSCGAKL